MNKPTNLIALCAVACVAAGCASYDKAVQEQKVAYKKAEKREIGLDIPPDLTAQTPDEQFTIPDGTGASREVTASSYYSDKGRVLVSAEQVLVSSADIKLKQVGSTRSVLVAKTTPDKLWASLRKFWDEQGFELTTDDPRTGVLETNWKENRAAIPMDGVRKVIGKVLDGIYSSNQRDRYIMRVEPTGDGGSEVFIAHRGLEEAYTDKSQTDMRWVSRSGDHDLEAIMTNRLLVKLTGDEKAAEKTGVDAIKALITVQKDGANGPQIVLAESFPTAWRRVGVGLDRAGFIMEDRDRANGTYYVRYAPDSAASSKQEPGFFGKLFGQRDGLTSGQRFQLFLEAKDDNTCVARFVSDSGKPLKADLANQAIEKLSPQLK